MCHRRRDLTGEPRKPLPDTFLCGGMMTTKERAKRARTDSFRRSGMMGISETLGSEMSQ